MKLLILLLLVVGKAYAQSKVPVEAINLDSLRRLNTMPNARPNIGFYRNPNDPANVKRSSLDNMPIKTPDTAILYTMPQQRYQAVPPETRPRQQPKKKD